ncbi:MAG: cytochrome c biogenesis protein CcdA, partial [Acidobacteria bacterium]|nr:cytochrome c biogenesis protein CcdA [Acidobacteriota bacterium]
SGVLLIAIGLLIFTNRFTIIAQWLTPYLPVY